MVISPYLIILIITIGLILLFTYWVSRIKFPFIKEQYPYECGPRCLEMIAQYYGKSVDFETIAQNAEMSKIHGTSLLGLTNAAEKMGFKSISVRIPFYSKIPSEESIQKMRLPCIAHWDENYFVIVNRITKSRVWIVHPRKGPLELSAKEFCDKWLPYEKEEGIIMLIEK